MSLSLRPKNRNLLLSFVICLFYFSAVFSQQIQIKDLLNTPWVYDGQEVIVRGEVIGNVMKRKDGVWFNVLDETGAMGIWTESLDVYLQGGSYNRTGTIVLVKGFFNRACPKHGGQIDIHSNEIDIISDSTERQHPLDKGKLKILTLLGILFLVAIVFNFILIARRKRWLKNSV